MDVATVQMLVKYAGPVVVSILAFLLSAWAWDRRSK